jgi:hypothetical protein
MGEGFWAKKMRRTPGKAAVQGGGGTESVACKVKGRAGLERRKKAGLLPSSGPPHAETPGARRARWGRGQWAAATARRAPGVPRSALLRRTACQLGPGCIGLRGAGLAPDPRRRQVAARRRPRSRRRLAPAASPAASPAVPPRRVTR